MKKRDRPVSELIQDVRRRYQRRVLWQGAALACSVLLVCLAIVVIVGGDSLSFVVVSALVAAGLIGMIVLFVVRPGLRRLSDEQLALYVEEKIPDLEDRLNSAVEAGKSSVKAGDGTLVQRLFEDAAGKTGTILPGTVVDRMRERLLTVTAVVCLLAFVIMGIAAFDQIEFTASSVLETIAAQPFMIIDPGDVEVEKGETQRVVATLREDTGETVQIVYREGIGEWMREEMRKGLDNPAYMKEFLDIQETIEYYVETDEVRSEPHRITTYAFPAVQQIDLTYHFPSYTGLAAQREEDYGDIRGLSGSRVVIQVQTSGQAEEAQLLLSGGDTVRLRSMGSGMFQGEILLQQEQSYIVELTDARGKKNKFPDQYQIVPVPDVKPYITITDPGRDTRANAIEEVLIAADAEDDYGITDLRLVFSVNGDEEQVVPLGKDMLRERKVSGEHLLFLEDHVLQPGDVITYFVEARDAFHASGAVTDMYFIEIIPFDQTYTQVNNAGGGQGGGGQSGLVLSQQEIIAATWKLLHQQEDMKGGEVEESLSGLVQAQTNLKSNIEERIGSTAFSLELRGDNEQQRVVAYLRTATEEMERALVLLHLEELREALTPERRALSALLRADALNKENQVARQGDARGGGGMGATEERMTELMDLELDISRDKYEVQQQRPAAQGKEASESLQKVKDLARRQQNLADQSNPDQLQGEDKKRFVDRLQREQDELRNQVEELARSLRGQEQGSRTQEGLARSLRNMREAERALRRKNMAEALGRQQQALDALQQVQQDLERTARGSLREQVQELVKDMKAVEEQERQLRRDLEEREDLERLEESRQSGIKEMEAVLDKAEDMRREAQTEDQKLATTLRNLLQQAQRDGLLDHMLDSREAIRNGWVDSADRIQEEILASFERMQAERSALEDSLPVTEEEQLGRTLNDLRDVEEQLQGLEEQAARLRQGEGSRAAEVRMQRQLERTQKALQQLQGQTGNAGGPQQRALSEVERALSRAENTGVLLDEESAKTFFNASIYDPLSRLEVVLSEQLDAIVLEKKLYGSRRDDVPPEYRNMVEKYYELLSKQDDRQ